MDLTAFVVYIDYIFSTMVEYMHKILDLLGIEWVEEESGTGIFDKLLGMF